MGKLHLFDMDGTLLHGSAAAIEISRQLGLDREIAELERGFAAGELTPPQFAQLACDLWAAELTERQVAAAFESAPWLLGIREVWADIRARGERCAVISLSPGFFVERLLGVGCGYRARIALARRADHGTGGAGRHPLLGGEGRIADELCAQYGLTRADCVAYGDSMSDVDLFAAVPASVAVNADHHVSDLASFAYAGRDLREAYDLGSFRTGR